MTEMDTFVKALKSHDWYYDYSDDHSVWKQGEAERAQLRMMYRAFDAGLARNVWNEHAPDTFKLK